MYAIYYYVIYIIPETLEMYTTYRPTLTNGGYIKCVCQNICADVCPSHKPMSIYRGDLFKNCIFTCAHLLRVYWTFMSTSYASEKRWQNAGHSTGVRNLSLPPFCPYRLPRNTCRALGHIIMYAAICKIVAVIGHPRVQACE